MAPEFLIDELAAATGTTTRSIRSFQSMGLLDPPALRGRTGVYTDGHLERLCAVLQLQEEGFSLPSVTLLFEAFGLGKSLAEVLHVSEQCATATPLADADTVELYGFPELPETLRQRGSAGRRPFLSVVPTTVWDESDAS